MEPKFQSSFIPKGPVATASPLSPQYSKPKTTILGFISVLAFVLSVLLSIGVFAYERYLLSSIGTMGQNLKETRASLQPEIINELVSANKRITGTRTLISQHTALTPFFDYLETSTLKSVRFTSFAYTTTNKGIDLIMKGQARSYADVALQSDAFNTSKIFIKPVFSDLDLDSKGNVIFTFHATLDPSIVSYKKRLEGLTSQPAATTNATTSVSTVATTTTATTTKASIKTATTTATTTKQVTR